MKVLNLLEFLNSIKELDSLEFATCSCELLDLLELMLEEEQFTQKIDLGLVFLYQKTLDEFIIVDGLSRLVSLSLLLHAVCECYKKTTPKNDSAIRTIRSKYLLSGSNTKLKLPEDLQSVYYKIIFGERLSGKEKESSIFKLLHFYWSKIKEESLTASDIFKILNKIYITVIYTENVTVRDLYYKLNKDSGKIKQLRLIDSYLKNIGINEEWNEIKNIFQNKSADIKMFFKDFFATKFNFKSYNENRLYEIFVNYFETMLQYMSEDVVISKIRRSAKCYNNIININFSNEQIKHLMIKIKMHQGEDTYSYLLNIYEDYLDNNLTEATFLEILSTIDEYLVNRIKTPNNINFNELVNYLNAFITCR